ncbi:CspA family cold shock protein [Pedobacter sp. W3I1]|uniref:cold shock domain-containing protein n=1 Tax=Pedobacter sp. W3I1 TaxID=3042291 RepID=UPI00277D618C|nr:cold shock domain-containing protein [Pedobacter sp. W3I1]MDQ0638703.1 CspA family cold shock protein [Pedobacter sp. W3I1]
MRLGTVKFYNQQEGVGSIIPSNGGREVSVFAHGVVDPIKPNNIVQFDIEFTQNGIEAIKVIVLSA